MALSQINIGAIANDGTGDTLRAAFTKTNAGLTATDVVSLGYAAAGTQEPGYYYNKDNGTKTANILYNAISYDVVGGEAGYRVSGATTGVATALACYFGAGGFISSQFVGIAGGVLTRYRDQALTIPNGTVRIAITSYRDEYPELQVSKVQAAATGQGEDQRQIAREQAATGALNKRGKTILWLGTSIPLGTPLGAAWNYPMQVGRNLGAIVLNQGLGASTIRRGVFSAEGVVPGDTYGWSGQTYQAAAYALSGTLAEKNDLIANYVSKWRAMFSGSPPTTLDAAEQAFILASSYENRVTPYLATTDLLVIDHGYNDLAAANDITTVPANSRNRGTFLGAVNFIIDQYLAVNPRGRVAFSGHYENQLKPSIAEAQVIAANYWQFPICKLWEQTGWSQQIVTVSGSPKTLLEVACPDGVHPYSDTTGASTLLLANMLTNFIREVR